MEQILPPTPQKKKQKNSLVYLDFGLLASRAEKINFCYLSHSACGTLLMRSWELIELTLLFYK